jgi:hypothetical protein
MTMLRRTRSVGRFDHTPWDVPWDGGGGEEGGEYESPTAHIIRMAGEGSRDGGRPGREGW